MQDINSKYDIEKQPFIVVKNNIVVKVSRTFTNLVEYSIEELLNKNIVDLFKILRVGPNLDIENIDDGIDYFLFTKLLEVRFVNIEVIKKIDEQIYILKEKPNSRLEDKFSYLYTILCENMSGVSIFSASDLRLLKANQKYLDFFDDPYNTFENTLGEPINEIFSDWKDSDIERLWKDAIKTGKSQCLKEYEYNKFETGLTYWDIAITPIKESGEVKYIVCSRQDVTERVLYRKKVEEQMKEIKLQNKQMEVIFENMNEMIIIYDKTGCVIYTNLKARKSYPHIKIGSKVEKFLERIQCFDLENDPISLNDLPVGRVFKGEKIRNERFIVKFSGKTVVVEANAVPIFDDENNLMLAVVSCHDISKTIEYEEKLSKRNKLLKNIMNNIQENMVVFDKNGDVLFADKVSKEIVHNVIDNTKRYYDSTKTYDFDGKEIPFEDAHIFRIMKGETINNEITYYKSNGERYYSMLYGKPIFDNKGNFLYGFYCRNNITDFVGKEQMLRKTQEQLLKLEREKNESLEKALEMKDEFLSLISHEFRTPLNVINSAVQTLKLVYDKDMTDKVKNYIGIIRQNTNRQLRLVNNLLDITRANAGSIKINKKNIDIVFVTKSIIESVYEFSYQKGISVTFKSSLSKKIIALDDEKYERIILNLLSNAIKFTPKGKDISLNIYSIKGNVCIDVKDNGIGIPPDKIDIIFDRFGQVDSLLSRQAEGSGIGLSLVKKFVEALGGSISVKSKIDNGSTFTIKLPDEMVMEEDRENLMADLMDNRLIETTNIEFSDIYL